MEGADRRSVIVLLIVAGAAFMQNLDSTVISTALPRIAWSFGVAPVTVSIGVTAYLLAVAAFIPVSGWLADRFGARAIFGGSIAMFTVASALCGLSGSLGEFTAFRVLQGIAGAMMVPVGRLLMLRRTAKQDLMRATAYVTWPALAAPALGPPLGGFIATYFSWRWIFFINLPLGIAGLIAVWIFVPDMSSEERRPFDLPGFLLNGLAVGTLMFGLDRLGSAGGRWPLAGGAVVVGALLGVAAVRHASRTPHPLMDLSAMRIPTFALNVWSGSLFRMAVNTVPFLLPLLFQVGFGLSPFTSGLLVLAVFAGNLGIKTLTTQTLRRFGFRTVLMVNGLLVAASIFACMTFTSHTPIALIVIICFLGGACRSMQFSGFMTITFADVPAEQMSGANAFASMLMPMASGMGVACAAMFVHFSAAIRGGSAPGSWDFRVGFAVAGIAALLSVLWFPGLDREAGAEVSGHRRKATV